MRHRRRHRARHQQPNRAHGRGPAGTGVLPDGHQPAVRDRSCGSRPLRCCRRQQRPALMCSSRSVSASTSSGSPSSWSCSLWCASSPSGRAADRRTCGNLCNLTASRRQPELYCAAMTSILFTSVRVFDGVNEVLYHALRRVGVRQRDRAHLCRADHGRQRYRRHRRRRSRADCPASSMRTGTRLSSVWHRRLRSTADVGYIHLIAGREAERALLPRVRLGPRLRRPSFAQACHEGVVPGPRIYPSGAMIPQTSGHGDFPGAPRGPRATRARTCRTVR